jgi:Lon protease-like protein
MTNFIPIFPLGLVVYPGENLNLHIFEPRYKQLITECHQGGKAFGIPPVLENRMQEFGSLVQITEVSKVYENGEMDIKTRGVKIFRILELIRDVPDKLYSGAIVNYPDNDESRQPGLLQRVLEQLRELHRLLQVNKEFGAADERLRAYDLAHHAGLSLQQEYELLGLLTEPQRLEYLKRHLKQAIPLLSEMEQLKEKIRLNGHFKNLSGYDIG